jgi:hypothetical protein
VLVEIKESGEAEALPWEALCADDDFLALDERWALGRLVDTGDRRTTAYKLAPPLRIAAVLSCLGVPAAGELAALREAVRKAGTDHVRLLVVASEEQLVVDLRAEMAAGTAPEIAAAELVPDELSDLQSMVAAFAPHVLHFYCHGSPQGNIAVARKRDWKAPVPSVGLIAEPRDFRAFTVPTDDVPWLVVLNCCESAAPAAGAADSRSLALSLAMERIAPAVVGMREPVVSDTANVVTKTLYGKLLADVKKRIEAPGNSVESMDWARFVAAARDGLARIHDGLSVSQAAASTKEWTLPVVYVRPDVFEFEVLAPGVDSPEETAGERTARLEIEALQGLLKSLPPEQAEGLREDANRRIDELSTALRAAAVRGPAGAGA